MTRSVLPQPFSFPNSGQDKQRQPVTFTSGAPEALRSQRGLRFPAQKKEEHESQDDSVGKETRHVNFGADYDSGYDDYGGGEEGGYGGGGGGYGGGGGGGGAYGGGGYSQGGYGDHGGFGQGHGFGQQGAGYPVGPGAPGAGYPHGGDYDEGAGGYGDHGHYA